MWQMPSPPASPAPSSMLTPPPSPPPSAPPSPPPSPPRRSNNSQEEKYDTTQQAPSVELPRPRWFKLRRSKRIREKRVLEKFRKLVRLLLIDWAFECPDYPLFKDYIRTRKYEDAQFWKDIPVKEPRMLGYLVEVKKEATYDKYL